VKLVSLVNIESIMDRFFGPKSHRSEDNIQTELNRRLDEQGVPPVPADFEIADIGAGTELDTSVHNFGFEFPLGM